MDHPQLFDTAYSQRRLLYLTALNNVNGRLNSPLYIYLGETIDDQRLQHAIDALVKRHEILRTSFLLHNEQLVQALHAPFSCDIRKETTRKMTLPEMKAAYTPTVFDVAQIPLFKSIVEKTSDNGYWLCFDKHLLLSDHCSDKVLTEDLIKLYHGETLTEIEYQYVDFSLLQQQQLESEAVTDITQLWINAFKKETPSIHIPPEVMAESKTGVEVTWSWEGEVYQQYVKAAAAQNFELPELLLTAFYVLLYRYFGEDTLVISCTWPGRNRPEFGRTCGYFENIIPLKKTLEGNELFSDFYQTIHRSWQLMSFYQEVPFDAVIQQLRDKWNVGTDKLFDIGYHYRQEAGEVASTTVEPLDQTLLLSCKEYSGQKLSFTLKGDPALVSADTVARFAAYYREIITAVLSAPDVSIATLHLMPKQEEDLLLKTFNADVHDFNIVAPVHRYFEEQADRFPGQPAVVHNGMHITYHSLNAEANKLAWLLTETGLKNDTFVGVYRDRDIQLVVALMGIMKAGGVYVPFDIQNPESRTGSLLRDCQAPVLITSSQLLEEQWQLLADLPALRYIICLEDLGAQKIQWETQTGKRLFDKNDIASRPDNNLSCLIGVNDWAYMLYTSGSTGEPKGAITRHNGALNHIFAEYRALDLPTGFRFLQSANISSDISVWQILAPLLKGGAVVIIDQDDLLNYEKLHRIVADNDITILEFVPSFLNGWVDYLEENSDHLTPLPSLQWMMMVGEEVPVNLVNRWLALFPQTNVLNGYGPCEASDDIAQYAMVRPLESGRKKVPIGKPLANLHIFILDKRAQLLPLGAMGEICVAGVGVGAGYWNKPANTARNFIPNHFPGTVGDTIYKTGDIGRWLPDGNLEFWGRADDQVKVRGFRVETGEIEVVIRTHDAVKDVAVVVREMPDGEKSMVAFLLLKNIAAGKKAVGEAIAGIRQLCVQRLPSYMIPGQFKPVEGIVLNLSGKVDKKQLLTLLEEPAEDEDTYVPPGNSTEQKLCDLWEVVLNKEQVSVRANFFAIGGHSLKATQIISKVFKSWGVNLRLAEIFNNPTIEALAKVIIKAEQEQLHRIERVEEQDYYGLSHAQQRLWLLEYLAENHTVYNIPSSYIFRGTINTQAFGTAFKILLERHEALRTSFHSIDGRPVQRIHAPEDIPFQLGYLSLQDHPDRLLKAREMADKEMTEAFDLEKVPLLRATLIQLETDECLFLFTMHHIISDGWSAELLQNEFFTIYHALLQGNIHPLPPLRLQYKDFVYWHNNLDLSKEEAYWLEKISGNYPLIRLPYDHDTSAARSADGAIVSMEVKDTVLRQLKAISAEKRTSLSNLFFTVFNILLYNISGQNELQVGVAVANRNHPDLEALLGFFVNVMVIRTELQEDITFMEALERISRDMTAAYDHQHYPFDLLVSKLNPLRNDNQQPLFNVMYAFQNYAGLTLNENETAMPAVHPLGFTVEPYEKEFRTAKFDLTLFVFDHEDAVSISFEYNTGLFEETTIKNIGNSYLEFLEYAAGPGVLAVS